MLLAWRNAHPINSDTNSDDNFTASHVRFRLQFSHARGPRAIERDFDEFYAAHARAVDDIAIDQYPMGTSYD